MINLNGKNLAKLHRIFADEYIKNLSQKKDVIGIVILGGAARGYADKYSDVDIAIFTNNEKIKLPRGERMFSDHDIDQMIFHLPSWKKVDWSDAMRQAFEEGVIVYDPKGFIKPLLKKKLALTEKERKIKIVKSIIHLGWHGIKYRRKIRWGGYNFILPADLWLKRGCIPCAHSILNSCVDIFIQLLYSYNFRFVPDPKWRLYHVYNLPWIPKNFKKKMDVVISSKSTSSTNFMKRVNTLQSMYNETIDRIVKERILPRNLYSFFLDNTGDYSVKPPQM